MPLTGPPLAPDDIVPMHRILEAGLARDPDGIAYGSVLAERTWRGLDRASTAYAKHLLAMGLKPGDRVASLMPNRGALLIHYLGCLKARLAATPLNYRYMAPEIDHALEVSGAAALLSHVERAEDLAKSKLANNLPFGRITFAAEDAPNTHFGSLIKDPPDVDLPEPDPDDPAFILFTSGSTGAPKGVTHTHRTFGRVLASQIKSCRVTADDIFMQGSSISHLGGLRSSLSSLAVGARVIGSRSFDGSEFLPLLRKYRPTFVQALPAAVFSLERDHDAKREDFASVRLLISGGDKVSSVLEEEFMALTGFPITEVYGMTETSISTISPLDRPPRLGSVGRACFGFQLSIRDEDGTEVAAGEEGKLWVKSPTNMVGYWDNPEATAETIVDGWLDTGDLMRADEDGFLWFRGRRKQIIVHDGSNICPQEVEDALLSHPAISLCCVVGIHDDVHGENVRAYVALKEGVSGVNHQEVIRHARDQVGYKAPEDIVVLPEMPLNPTGKVDRVTLKRMAAEQEHPADRAA